MVFTSCRFGSSTIAGSTKKLTGMSMLAPAASRCSVKQKHCTLLKYCPAFSGVTLKVAVHAVGWTERFSARKNASRSEEHTSELQVTNAHLVCRLLLEKKKKH